jgi:glucosylceramidase
MSDKTTRRNFLKASGLGAAVLAGGVELGAFAGRAGNAGASGEISVWVTDDHQRCANAPSISWKPGSASRAAITLRPEEKCQPILGFGAAFTDAACYTLNRLDPSEREKLLHQLLHPSGMGFSVCRTCIGSSDYSTKVFSYDEGEVDPSLSRFSIEQDRAYVLPVLREARRANPDLFLFSSPWSPPGWMKSNGSMLGGNMHRQYMASYANYFVKFLQAYEAEGVPVEAITIQNEVDTDQDGRMPACIWPQEYEADFVRTYLGPTFERERVKSKIWLIDHNYNLWGRAMGELETQDVRKYSNAIAWHGYVGKPEWIDRVQKTYPDVEMYWTEGGPDYTEPEYATNWVHWSSVFTDILRHCCRSITAWNFALDERGRPNIGPFHCGGLLTIHSETREISYSGQYHAFAHYSRFVRRGAWRFPSEGVPELHHASFENTDGRRVLIVTNAGAPRSVDIQLGGRHSQITLTANSITTLAWES